MPSALWWVPELRQGLSGPGRTLEEGEESWRTKAPLCRGQLCLGSAEALGMPGVRGQNRSVDRTTGHRRREVRTRERSLKGALGSCPHRKGMETSVNAQEQDRNQRGCQAGVGCRGGGHESPKFY